MTASYHARPLRSARFPSGIVLLLAAATTSCGPPSEPRTPPEEPPPPEPSIPQAELLESSRALPVVFGSIETREHFGEDLVGELRMSESARSPYLDGQTLPEGARLALVLRAPEGSHPEAPSREGASPGEPWRVLWMEKADGGWRFQAELGGGDLASRVGGTPTVDVSACTRCHAEAPRDYVFRIRDPNGNAVDG